MTNELSPEEFRAIHRISYESDIDEIKNRPRCVRFFAKLLDPFICFLVAFPVVFLLILFLLSIER